MDIVKGKPTLGIGGCGLGERTIARILAELAPPKSNFLIKVRLGRKDAVTPFYGLNLPGFLELIKIWWEASVLERSEGQGPHGGT